MYEIAIVGAGMSGLSAACWLAEAGKKVVVLEQNYLPGGCTSSYWRKGFVFEAGATTVVGLDPGMPLYHLLHRCGIEVPATKLTVPMQVVLPDGQVITRHADLEAWIAEAESVFGMVGQRPFWTLCHQLATQVWRTSVQQLHFPPQNLTDLWQTLRHATLGQLRQMPYAFTSTLDFIKRFGLADNEPFLRFVNEQLMITAQNHAHEVNALFGATALCYTLVGNYYVRGGLLELVNPMVNYLEGKGCPVLLRHKVSKVDRLAQGWQLETNRGTFVAKKLIMAIPANNTAQLLPYKQRTMPIAELASAFQLSLAFMPHRTYDCLHHQLHLTTPLPGLASGSVFLSLSQVDDTMRTDVPGAMVASVTTHIAQPDTAELDIGAITSAILHLLEDCNLIMTASILYQHVSTANAWQKWTGRAGGAVGGYPQLMATKPWQMLGHRLSNGAYQCGDTTYPGQGIPGACLSGLIVAHKLLADRD